MSGLNQETHLETHEVQLVVLEVKQIKILWRTTAFVLA
jgi:hypothetical protein